MNIQQRAEKAVELKKSGSCNCCQAVAMALADQTGMEEQLLWQAAAGFGGGIGNMEGACGALCGAVIAAGLKSQGAGSVRYTRRINEAFKRMCGAITCKTLKGLDGGGVFCPCDECVKNAVLAYGEAMEVE